MKQWISAINNRKTTIEKKSTPIVTHEITADVYENPDEIHEIAAAPTLPPRNPPLLSAPKMSASNPYSNSDQNDNMDDEGNIYDEPQINPKKDTEPTNPLLAAAVRYDISIPIQTPQNEPDLHYDKINNVESNIDSNDIYDEPGKVVPSSEQEDDNIYNDLLQTSSVPPKNEIRPIKAEIMPSDEVCNDLEVVNFINGNTPEKIEDNDDYYDELSTPVEPAKPKPVVKPKPKLNKRLSERFTRKISVDNNVESAESVQSPKKLNLTIIQKMERSLAGNFYNKK